MHTFTKALKFIPVELETGATGGPVELILATGGGFLAFT